MGSVWGGMKDERRVGASAEPEAGHRVFGGSSWESDDRMVFGNLRVAWSALFPLDDSSRKEGFSFQRLWLYLYYTFSSKGSFKGRQLFSVARVYVLSLTVWLLLDERPLFLHNCPAGNKYAAELCSSLTYTLVNSKH